MVAVFFSTLESRRQKQQIFLYYISYDVDSFGTRQYYSPTEQSPTYCVDTDTKEMHSRFACLDDQGTQQSNTPPSKELADY